MQYKNTIEALYIQLNEVQQNIASWGADKELRKIDIDLALDKLRNVYDLVLSLKAEPNFMQAPLEEPNTQLVDDTIEITKEVIESKPEKVPEIKVEAKTENIKKTTEQIITELTKKVPKTSASNEKSNLSEKFSHNRPTLNEELSSQVESADLANQLKNRPVTNLSSAIGLNEKFEFINNLFNGDKVKYEETIDKLNMATNFNEAYNYLSIKLNWDMSDPSIQRILDLIRRKLISNKNG